MEHVVDLITEEIKALSETPTVGMTSKRQLCIIKGFPSYTPCCLLTMTLHLSSLSLLADMQAAIQITVPPLQAPENRHGMSSGKPHLLPALDHVMS